MIRSRLARVGLAIAAVLVVAGCTSADPQTDQQGLLYHTGPQDGHTFDQCVKPGVHEYGDLWGGESFLYPQGQRTYEFDTPKKESGAAETGDVAIVTSDGATLGARGLLNFTLTSDCKLLQRFHEKIGLKYGAGDGDNGGIKDGDWTRLLNNYLGIPLRDTLKIEARKYSARDLYFDTDGAREKWIDASIKALPGEVEELAQGGYFDGFTLKVPDIFLPDNLRKQIEEQLVQVERLATIDAQATASAREREQMQALLQLFGGWQGYIAYRNQLACEEEKPGCVPFIPIPQGSNITVSPGG